MILKNCVHAIHKIFMGIWFRNRKYVKHVYVFVLYSFGIVFDLFTLAALNLVHEIYHIQTIFIPYFDDIQNYVC